MCCYRDAKNFDRFNYIIRSLIYLIINKLRDLRTIIANSSKGEEIPAQPSNQQQKEDKVPPDDDENNKEKKKEKQEEVEEEPGKDAPVKAAAEDDKEAEPKKSEEIWTVQELEKVLIFISKVFLLNFPLYIAHKHGTHYGHESTQQEIQSVSVFCDIHDTEIPVYLYHNVTLFCTAGGFGALTQCFEISELPLSLAHACTVAISNIKLWLNFRSIVQLFVPLRIKVLQYMCKLSDQDLRSPATKSMAGE
jgi:ubiquitin carboxyl-terminal hydrolase 34